MTLFQALLIAAAGYLGSIYSPWLTGLGGWYTLGRPLIAGFVIGLILGDVQAGILMGAAVQAVFIGLVTPGGSMPGDANLAAYIGIPLAMASKLDTEFAVSMSVLLSMVGVLAVLVVVTVNCLFVHRMDKDIDAGNLKRAMSVPVVGQVTNFAVRFIPIFLACYFGQGLVTLIVEGLPIAVVGIFGMFGTLLPLVGFALLLSFMVKKTADLLFFALGFVLTAALKMPVLGILVVAGVLAYTELRAQPAEKVVREQAPERARLLDKKDVRRCYWSWMMWNLSAQNMERMEAPALVRMIGGVKDKLYPNDLKKQQALLARQTPFFNTEPYVGCLVPGVVLGMEEENAATGEVPDELILGVKASLMGPLAGIGDSLYVGTLIPILLGIAMGMSGETGSVAGPLFYIAAHLAIMFPLTWFLFNSGYKGGINSAKSILEGGLKDRITRALSVVGLCVVGSITASTVTITSGWVFTRGDMIIDLNEILGGIFPNFITFALALATYWLMAKKKVKIGWMFLIYFVLSIVGLLTSFFHIA